MRKSLVDEGAPSSVITSISSGASANILVMWPRGLEIVALQDIKRMLASIEVGLKGQNVHTGAQAYSQERRRRVETAS